MTLDQLAAYLFDEVLGRDHFGRRAPAHDQRFRHSLLCLLLVDEADVEHAPDHPVAPRQGGFRPALGMVPRRRLGQAGEERGFADGQLVQRFVEVVERRCGDAIGADAEIDLIEI